MRRLAVAVVVALLAAASGCAAGSPPLRVVAGGGVADFAGEIVARYRASHPDRVVELVAGGDVELVDRVAAGELAADVLLVSDAALIGELQQSEWTSFQVRFAGDRMVLVLADGIEPGDRGWTELLLDPEIAVVAADPARTSLGYRFDFVLRLHDRAMPETPTADAVIARADAAGRVADEAPLREALRNGTVEATLLYASLAARAGLRIVELPESVDLGSVHLAAVYSPVTMPLAHGRDVRLATPIRHAVTIPDATPQRAEAIDFLAMLLDADARALMQRSGLTPVAGEERVVSFGLPADVEQVLEATAE